MAQQMPQQGGMNPSHSQPAAVTTERMFQPIRVVQIEGSTLLKIIKYCAESKTPVSGRILGLQRGNTLEVTNCFPHCMFLRAN